MSELKASVVMNLHGNFELQTRRNGRALGNFSRDSDKQLSRVRRSAQSVGQALDSMGNRYTAMIAGAATTYAATRAVIESGKLDKRLIQIQQTAGATADQADKLREHLHTMSEETGQSLDSLLGGFNSLVQAGQTWEEALTTITAINPAMAVTGAQAEVLANALGVAGYAFQFDLSNPKAAVSILDQMTVAGRLGNAELEDLSSIFASAGVNAKTANLSFEETLGFIEQLSMMERDPSKLATLTNSTLRLFTTGKYMENASKVTGVDFFDADGARRNAFAVLDDISARYRSLETDTQRKNFVSAAFGQTDQDTIKGLRTLLAGDTIEQARQKTQEIRESAGVINKDLDEALGNAVDQVARLMNALRTAADGFAQPINDAIEGAVKYLLDEKGLSGKDILGGAAVAAGVGLGLAKGGGKLLQRFGGVGAGVAAGKALEEVAGITPVYVVNMPGGGMGAGIGGPARGPGAGRNRNIFRPGDNLRRMGKVPVGSLKLLGAAGLGIGAAGVTAAGAVGYGAGSLINTAIDGTALGNSIGEAVAKTLAFFGNEEAKAAVAANERTKDAGTLSIKVDQDGRIRSITPQRGADGPDIDVDLGITGLVQ